MKKILFSILFFLLTASVLFAQTITDKLTIVTEEWPPYNYTVDGKVTGLGAEIIYELLKDVGIVATIESYPWNRAYLMAETIPNVLIFTLARTPERENKFKWIGKISPREVGLFKFKDRKDIAGKNLDDFKKYLIGVTTNEDATTKYLISQGFVIGKNLIAEQSANAEQINIKRFFVLKRFDLLPINELSLSYLTKKMGYNVDELEKIMVLTGSDDPGYFAAFSISTPDETVKKFIDAYKKMVDDGRYKRIYDNYLK